MDPTLSELVENVDLSIGALNILPSQDIQINDVFEFTEKLAFDAEKKGKNAYNIEYYRLH